VDAPARPPQIVRDAVAKLQRGLRLRNFGICIEVDHLARCVDCRRSKNATRRRLEASGSSHGDSKRSYDPRPDAIQRAGKVSVTRNMAVDTGLVSIEERQHVAQFALFELSRRAFVEPLRCSHWPRATKLPKPRAGRSVRAGSA